MRQITKRAYAKINLSLDVLRKREDGYHEVRMVMHQINLYDDVTVKIDTIQANRNFVPVSKGHATAADEGHRITLTTNNEKIPTDESNIACKAARTILKEYHEKDRFHIQIHIEKRIPVSAGLAGGSSNAAAVLLGLRSLLGLEIPADKLMVMGKSLGADVPFCILGGCALAEGIGEKLTPLPEVDMKLLLSKPDIEVSTAKVYGSLDVSQIQEHPNTDVLIEDLRHVQMQTGGDKMENLQKIYENMKNVLETVTLKQYPIVMHTKNRMIETGAEHVLMSGSGPSVFGVYTDEATLQAAYDKLKTINHETFMVRTII